MSNELLIKLENISKEYKTNTKVIKVLNDVNAKFYSGKFYAIMGHSGSGKSTLVNILALIDNFDSGAYYLYNLNIKDFNDKKLYIVNDYSDIIYFNNAPIIFGDYLYNMTTCEIRNYFGISPRNKFKLFKNKIKAKVS